jgi:peptide/nickel transport system substrate-binding protein
MARNNRITVHVRRSSAMLVIVGLGIAGLAACAPSGSDSTQGSSQTWIVPQDWGAIDPTKEAATNMGAILLVLEPLVLLTESGSVEPNLATQTQPNPTTYVYTLRKGAKFSDGKPVTIQDVKYSIDIHTAKNSTSNLASNFGEVASVTTQGTDKLVITLTQPDVQFQDYMAETGIVEKAVREKLGNNPGSPGKLNVGSGPYEVSKYQPGSELILKANPDYWGAKPAVSTLNLKFISDDSARQLAVQSGDVTGAFEIPADQVKTYSAIPGMKVITGDNPSVMLFNVNTNVAPWNDVHVRQAVSLAINREGIVKSVLDGHGQPLWTPITAEKAEQVMSKSSVSSLFANLKTDDGLAAAKAELAKSSEPNGFTAKLLFSDAEAGTSGLVAQAVAAAVKPLGITLQVTSIPDSQYTDEVFFKQTAPASIVDFTTDIADPISLLNYLGNKSNLLSAGGYTNIASFSDPALSRTLDTYLETPATDKATRAKLLGEALTQFNASHSYIPIYNSQYLAVVKDDVTFKNFDGFWWQRRWIDDVSISK